MKMIPALIMAYSLFCNDDNKIKQLQKITNSYQNWLINIVFSFTL